MSQIQKHNTLIIINKKLYLGVVYEELFITVHYLSNPAHAF